MVAQVVNYVKLFVNRYYWPRWTRQPRGQRTFRAGVEAGGLGWRAQPGMVVAREFLPGTQKRPLQKAAATGPARCVEAVPGRKPAISRRLH